MDLPESLDLLASALDYSRRLSDKKWELIRKRDIESEEAVKLAGRKRTEKNQIALEGCAKQLANTVTQLDLITSASIQAIEKATAIARYGTYWRDYWKEFSQAEFIEEWDKLDV